MAYGFNLVEIVGANLTRDAVLRSTSGEWQVLDFSVAYNHTKGRDGVERVTYVDCALFTKNGGALAARMKKGQKVAISGELMTDNWTDNAGNQRSKNMVRAQNVVLMHTPPKTDGNQGQAPAGGGYSDGYNVEPQDGYGGGY